MDLLKWGERERRGYLNDETLEKLLVSVLVVGDTEKVLGRGVFHGGDNVVLCLKVLNPTGIQLRGVVAEDKKMESSLEAKGEEEEDEGKSSHIRLRISTCLSLRS